MTTQTDFFTSTSAVSATGQNAISRWMDEKVLYCQSVLVSELLNEFLPNTQNRYSWDEVENLYDDSMEAVEEFLAYCDDITDEEREEILELPFDEREAKARDLGWEPEPKEIYEWWLVSRYFADKLREVGEPVFEAYGCVWWGRCCTGQWLGMDSVIVGLAREDGIVS